MFAYQTLVSMEEYVRQKQTIISASKWEQQLDCHNYLQVNILKRKGMFYGQVCSTCILTIRLSWVQVIERGDRSECVTRSTRKSKENERNVLQ